MTNAVVWAHAAIALIILIGAWGLHRRVQPYPFAFQNRLESWLFLSNVTLVLLGCGYTLARYVDSLAQALEWMLLVTLLGTLFISALYVLHHSHCGRRVLGCLATCCSCWKSTGNNTAPIVSVHASADADDVGDVPVPPPPAGGGTHRGSIVEVSLSFLRKPPPPAHAPGIPRRLSSLLGPSCSELQPDLVPLNAPLDDDDTQSHQAPVAPEASARVLQRVRANEQALTI